MGCGARREMGQSLVPDDICQGNQSRAALWLDAEDGDGVEQARPSPHGISHGGVFQAVRDGSRNDCPEAVDFHFLFPRRSLLGACGERSQGVEQRANLPAFHGKLAAKGQEKRICRGVGGIHVASRYVLKKMAEESPLFEPIWQDLQALSPDDFGFYMARDPDAAWLESIWPMEEQLFAEHRETRYRDFAGMKLAATTAEEKRLIEKADYLSAEGMVDEAVAVAEEVLGDGSGHCNGWFRRHHYLMQADRCEEAYELVKRGMAAYPDAAVFDRMGADCCIRLARWAAAERHLRRVWGVNPWDHRVMLQWALAAFSMENYELSAQLHGLAAEHRSLPLAAQAFYDLSLAVCGRHGEVPTASERMLDLVDSNPWAQLFAAMEMAGGGEYEYALELCAEALAVGEEIVEIWSSYGFILLKLRRYEEAEAALLKAIEMNPEFDDAWRYLLHVYRDWGQAEKLAKAEARVGYFWPETLERFGREKGTDIRE
jgi:tetratricopeptide (TPR) repeat protein